jgi:D-alanine transfer protein
VWDHALYEAALPFGWLEDAILSAQDHFIVLSHTMHDHWLRSAAPRVPVDLDWDALLDEAGMDSRKSKKPRATRHFLSDAAFAWTIQNSREWEDLELLLRTLKELGIEPLLLSIPIDSQHYEELGITRASLQIYLQRLRWLANRYDVALVDFAEHENDAQFFADHHDHLSAKGWMYFDKALDDFFHNHTQPM